jgi:hypothetical protein
MRRDAEITCVVRHCEAQGAKAIRKTKRNSGLRRFADGGALVLAAALLLPAPAEAAPKSIADCEAIQEADAYNRCLASFGPMRGQRGAGYPGVATGGGKGGKGGSAAARRGGGFPAGAQVTRGRGGRVRMEFTPGRR